MHSLYLPANLLRMLSFSRSARSAVLATHVQHARLCSAGKGRPPVAPKLTVEQQAKHAVVTSTHMFRLSNPEAFMDPNRRISWIVTGVVAALLAARLGFALWQDDGEFFEHKPPAPTASDVKKILPDGRRLMRDGSIQKG